MTVSYRLPGGSGGLACRLSAQSQDPPRIPPWRGASGRSSEHAVHTIAEQAVKADDLVDEAIEVGDGRHEA
jgi:hypothetical protein